MFLLMPWKLGLDHMLTMMFKMLTSMKLDYLHRSTMTNTLAWNLTDIAAVTSSTPPIEVVRLYSSLMISLKRAGGEPLVLQFLDASRAYPHAEVLRDDFYVERHVLLARRGWYGMRDAGQAFEFAVRDHFLDHDFKQGMFSRCVFAHRSKFLLYFVHGDDYVEFGVRGDLEGYKGKPSERFIIKDLGCRRLARDTNCEQSDHVSSSETRVSRDVDVRSGSETR